VATSLWQLGAIPGRTLRGTKHFLSPRDPNHLPLSGLRPLDDYQLCYWTCLEMDARARVLRERLEPRGVRVHAVVLEDIQSEDGLLALGARLGLTSLTTLGRMRIGRLARTRVNAKDDQKRRDALDPSHLDALEREVRERTRAQ
jgi:hypothetical protein